MRGVRGVSQYQGRRLRLNYNRPLLLAFYRYLFLLAKTFSPSIFGYSPYKEGRLANVAADGTGSTAGSMPSSPGIAMQPNAPLAQQLAQQHPAMQSESAGMTSIGSSGSARQLLSASPKTRRKADGTGGVSAGGGSGPRSAAAPISLGFSKGHKLSKQDIQRLSVKLRKRTLAPLPPRYARGHWCGG